MLRGTKAANSLSQLKALVDHPPRKQRELAQKLKAGAPQKILRKKRSAKYQYVRTADGVYRVVGREISGQLEVMGYKGGPITFVHRSAIIGAATKKEWLESPGPVPPRADTGAKKPTGQAAEPVVDGGANPRELAKPAAAQLTHDGNHKAPSPQEPSQGLPAAPTDDGIMDRFIRLGKEVRQLRGDEAFNRAVEHIRGHATDLDQPVVTQQL
jgi:hypothetical protein